MTQKHASQGILVTYLLLIFCDLTLTLKFLNQTSVLMQCPSQKYASTLGEFELVVARLADPRAQNVKKLHSDIWPSLDLTRDFKLKILKVD